MLLCVCLPCCAASLEALLLHKNRHLEHELTMCKLKVRQAGRGAGRQAQGAAGWQGGRQAGSRCGRLAGGQADRGAASVTSAAVALSGVQLRHKYRFQLELACALLSMAQGCSTLFSSGVYTDLGCWGLGPRGFDGRSCWGLGLSMLRGFVWAGGGVNPCAPPPICPLIAPGLPPSWWTCDTS